LQHPRENNYTANPKSATRATQRATNQAEYCLHQEGTIDVARKPSTHTSMEGARSTSGTPTY
jgi:hypothetical protein